MKNLLSKILFISLLLSAAIPSVMQANDGNLSKTGFNLEESIKSNNLAKIKQAIKSGTNVNQPFSDYCTPLIDAATNGCLEIVELLLANGADVNQKNNYGRTALMYAADNGCLEVVELLLANGAEVNLQNNYGGTALTGSAFRGSLEIVKLLLANGADVSVTELMDAAKWCNLEVVELLLTKLNWLKRLRYHVWNLLIQ